MSEARRVGLRLAAGQNWDETSAGRLAIVLTESSTNLVKHATRGEIHLRICSSGNPPGIEVLVFDHGPGVQDVNACLADGYSTTGTGGNGLGAIARLADEFDIYSQPGRGTCMVARLFPGSRAHAAPNQSRGFLLGSVQVPLRGEVECGDSWGVRIEADCTVLLLADGLGHGPGAAEASRAAVATLDRARDLAPAALLEQVHHALRSTRGAAVAIALINAPKGEVRFIGAGNISALIVKSSNVQHMISHNGTAGHNVRKFQEFVYPWSRNAAIVMHSDGITTSWRLDAYPGITERDPSLLAAALLRDASRGRDDACVLVGRERD